MSSLFKIGRVVFGGFFLYNGINHLTHSKALAGYAEAKGIPNPELSVQLSGALLAAAGAALVVGVSPRLGALGTAAFLAVTSPSMHDFWNATEPGQKQNDMIHFSKNIALLGAALALAGTKHESDSGKAHRCC